MDRIPLYPPATRWWMTLVAPFTTQWTVRRLAYVAARFPLSLAYFVTVVVCLAVGISLAWTIPGLALLIAVIVGARWLGDLEALLARHLAGVPFRRPPTWFDRSVSLRQQARQVGGDPSTWTGLIYLLVDLALGICSLVLLVVGVAFAVVFTFAPLIMNGFGPFDGSGDLVGSGTRAIDSVPEALWLVPVGIVLTVVLVHVVNACAYLYARWAGLMLGSRARNIPPPVPTDPPLDDVPPAGETPHAAVGSPAAPALASLTRREREVLRLIASGHSNAEIAEAFVVSEGPVKTHVKRVLAKLDVRDRTQAAVLAFNSGFAVPQIDAERTVEPAAQGERIALVR